MQRVFLTRTAKRFSSTYLHVGPSGDCWTGASIFAAKHLQPDYVKSISLPLNICAESLLEKLEDDTKLCQQIYDDEKLPEDLLKEAVADSTGSGAS